tara:strand:- start:316 stop:945 length:630 start_codon:yes stop_codon:yes gene_type:complete
MSKQVQRNGPYLTLAASKYQRVSDFFSPVDRKNIMVQVTLASYTLAAAIKVLLHDSMDGNLTSYPVGAQSEGSVVAKDVFAAADVTNAADTITLTGHIFSTGDKVLYTDGGGTVPAGLVTGTVYYAIKVDANTIKLATTQVQAYEGTPINLTTDGVGAAHGISPLVVNIRMIFEDATDQAQLPLAQSVAVYASTGAGDAVVIESISIED